MTIVLPTDQNARDRIASDLDTTLVVEAAAGTGKTTALVSRMMGVLESGRGRLDEMVAVTFTEAAAGELKLRLRIEIERRRLETSDVAVRQRLDQSLALLEVARIGTIHGFCAGLLRERPVEAMVDPRFQVATEDVKKMLVAQAFDRWFEDMLSSPPNGLRRALRRVQRDGGPRKALRKAATSLIDRRDFPAPWAEAPFDRAAAIDAIVDEMRVLAAKVEDYAEKDLFRRSLDEIAAFVSEVARRETVTGARDYDGLEAGLVDIADPWGAFRHWEKKGFPPGGRGDEAQERARRKADDVARRDLLRERLAQFRLDVNAELAPHLQRELWPVVTRYEGLKERARRLDFLDLLLLARSLVVRNPEVRRDFQQRFRHIFVDEFQDTDPVQAELLLLLAADDTSETDWTKVRPVPGKLFIVGDPKQSIYRFRRADVSLYRAIVDRLVARGARVLHLSVSFRSAPAIQEAVNAAFVRCMDGSTPSQAAYVPLQRYRAPLPGQPAIVALPTHQPYSEWGRVTRAAVETSVPETVAAFVRWLVNESGWRVGDRNGETVLVKPHHICLLFKRFRGFGGDVTAPYVNALDACEVPHILVGGTALHRRDEVLALRNALTAIERPDDELAVYATLHGPLFAIDDAALLAWKDRFRTVHPCRKVPDELDPALTHVAEALAVLRALHDERNRTPIPTTIGRLLQQTRAHAGLALWRGGEQALANVNRLIDESRQAEKAGLTSFRAFVEYLEDQAESGEVGEAPIVEEGTEGVRLMTVHRAKGLEFPVVILVDLGATLAPRIPDRWVDSTRGLCATPLADCAPRELREHADEEVTCQREEGQRVLYVAATRARDLLVMATVAQERLEGWLAPLYPAIYPPTERAMLPITTRPEGCGDLAGDEPSGPLERPSGVVPGLHLPEAGSAPVVWWNVHQFELTTSPSLGLRQHRLLASAGATSAGTAGITAHTAWSQARAEVRSAAARPSVRVITATEAADAGVLPPPGVTIRADTAIGTPRPPMGKRFGTLVHAALAAVDLDAEPHAVRACVDVQARIVGAPPDETDAAFTAIVDALACPLLRRAATAARDGRCHRELPVVWRDNDTLIEGVLDAAFLENGAWTVIDFKTDADTSLRADAYRAQVACYAEALRRATGHPVREAVLLTV